MLAVQRVIFLIIENINIRRGADEPAMSYVIVMLLFFITRIEREISAEEVVMRKAIITQMLICWLYKG